MDQDVLLARIDERTQAIERDIHAIKVSLRDEYVTKEEFHPFRLIVYGIVGGALMAVLVALLNIVIIK